MRRHGRRRARPSSPPGHQPDLGRRATVLGMPVNRNRRHPGDPQSTRVGFLTLIALTALVILAGLILAWHLDRTVRRTDRALFTFDSAEYALAGREVARSGA